ncbi:hypothetical protein PDQ04_18980 [Bacillus cereus]|uniref:hypothetical protein n=1 Tax=Bacillus cereus group TaxID=86661 RepID=UPI00192663BB|nr:hypothetical protein [Bacillus cereus]MBL3887889.1 hypothetical protein [Bacillus cereus]MCU4795801.1 hypothetical protein [Bacillus cereus]MDA2530478.1 hypothetical protein [Bacillus cereus]
MYDIFEALDLVFESNRDYLPKINSDIVSDTDKFGKWMSAFLVRRVKRNFLSDAMLIENLKEQASYKDFENHLQILEENFLVLTVDQYVIMTELGVIISLLAKCDEEAYQQKNLDSYIQRGYQYLINGIANHHLNKINKLFPEGLTTKEIVFVVFLMLNGAYNLENAFHVKESSAGILDDLSPVNRSLQQISEKLFDSTAFVVMESKEFSNFLRRNTMNGSIGRVFNSSYYHHYDKGENLRKICFNVMGRAVDKNTVLLSLDQLLKTLLNSLKNLSEKESFLLNFRELIVNYMVENPLAAHEQLKFFRNTNYRESLYLLLTVIDENLD